MNKTLIELNHNVPLDVRRKILRWFQNDLRMTSGGLLKKIGGNHVQYWSNYLNGSRPYAKYKGYQKMAEAYGISEEKFFKQMEIFIRESMSSEIDSDNTDPLYSLAKKEKLSPGQLEKIKNFVDFIKTQKD